MVKKLLFTLLLGAVAAIAAGGYIWQQVETYAEQAVTLKESKDTQLLTVSRGTSAAMLLNRLARDGQVANPQWARWWLKLEPELAGIRAGTYQITADQTLRQVMLHLNNGQEHHFELRLVEGLTFKQWRASLESHPELEHELTDLSEAEIMAKLSSEHSYPEGLFFPDNYLFVKGTSDLDILRRAYGRMEQQLAASWAERDSDLPYKSPYEALIMASIVEKETGKASERPLIAGVFVNRLEKRMRLQTDPTVIYGLGDDFDGRIRRKHLTGDTPYNTYTRFGLPPTPIAMPGKAAIDAALQPESTKYLYFVSRGDGSHQFSRTLRDHNRAVDKYIRGKK